MRALTVLALLAMSTFAGTAFAKTVDLPELPLWCSATVLPESAAADDGAVDAANEAAVRQLDAGLAASGIYTSGVPFVMSATRAVSQAVNDSQGPPPPNAGSFRIEVCTIVPATATQPQPSPLSKQSIPAARYVWMACAADAQEKCVDDLRRDLLSRFGASRKDLIYESPILATQLAAVSTEAAIAAAFAAGADRVSARGLNIVASSAAGDIDFANSRPLKLSAEARLATQGAPQTYGIIFAIREPSTP